MANIKVYEAKYIEGTFNLSSGEKGWLVLYLFDSKRKAVFKSESKGTSPLLGLVAESSNVMVIGNILAASIVEKKRYLRLDLETDTYAIFDVSSAVNEAIWRLSRATENESSNHQDTTAAPISKDHKCARCDALLLKPNKAHTPSKYWEFDGKLCDSCHKTVKDGIRVYESTYVEGQENILINCRGNLLVYFFDSRNKMIFVPEQKDIALIVIDAIKDCQIITGEDISLLKSVITIGQSRFKENRYLQVQYGAAKEIAIFEIKGLEEVNKIISARIQQSIDEDNTVSKDVEATELSKEEQTKKCWKCGALINTRDLKFGLHTCLFCGSNLNESPNNDLRSIEGENTPPVNEKLVCSECGHTNLPNSKFCNECGFKLQYICKKCNTHNPDGSKFCSQCGGQL